MARPLADRPLPPVWRQVVKLLWRAPLYAIPFALFFGTLFGDAGWPSYLRAYGMALVFAYVISGLSFANGQLVLPRIVAPRLAGGKVPVPVEIASYVATAIAGSFLAAAIVHFTIMPGMLGSGRSLLLTAMFSLLFSVLVTGVIYVWIFYQQALQRARSEQELEMARRIQRSFLLTRFPSSPRLEVHAYNRSSREVSGDFYDVVPGMDGDFLVALADVAGKGVPAALLTAMLQASLRTQAPTVSSTARMLLAINTLVHRTTAVAQFATFFLGRVDERRLELTYTNAGHNPPLLLRADGRVETLDIGGTVVGFLEDVTYDEGRVALAPGDRLVVYSDGLTEAEGADGEQYGEERLRAFLLGLPRDLAARETIERLTAELDRHLAGREAGDDVTLLVLRVLPAA